MAGWVNALPLTSPQGSSPSLVIAVLDREERQIYSSVLRQPGVIKPVAKGTLPGVEICGGESSAVRLLPFPSCSLGSAVPGGPFVVSRAGLTVDSVQDRFGFRR